MLIVGLYCSALIMILIYVDPYARLGDSMQILGRGRGWEGTRIPKAGLLYSHYIARLAHSCSPVIQVVNITELDHFPSRSL